MWSHLGGSGSVVSTLIRYPDDKITIVVLVNTRYAKLGALVFEGRDIPLGDESRGWDGTFKGKEMNIDVFAFYALIEFIDDEIILFEGDVTLVK